MKVRVKEGCIGWIYEQLREEGDEFTLVPVETHTGEILSPEQQYSDKWMERLKKPGRPRKQGGA